MKRLAAYFILFLFIMSLSTCVKDRFDIDHVSGGYWNPDMALPLLNSTASLLDLSKEVDNMDLVIGSDNLISLVYTDTIFNIFATDLYEIPDQQADTVFHWSFPIGLPTGDSVVQNFSFISSVTTPDADRLDSMHIREGTLHFELETDFNHDGRVQVHIPTLVKDGKPFQAVLYMDKNAPVPQSTTYSEDISGYSLRFTQGSSANEVNAQVMITGFGSANPVNNPYYFALSAAYESIEFNSLFGYFAQHQFSIAKDSLNIELFRSHDMGSFNVEDPRMHLRFVNSMGIPIASNISSLRAVSHNQEVPFTNQAGGPLDDIMLNYPLINNMWSSVITERTYNRTNSNLDDALNINPIWIIYDIDGSSNPAGYTFNYATHESSLGLISELEFPFYGTVSGITLRDTIREFDVSLDDLPGDGEIEYFELQMLMKNGMPLEAHVQVYFADQFMNITDSLFDGMGTILPSGKPGPAPDYRVMAPAVERTYIKRDKEQINKILDAENVIIHILGATKNLGTSTVKVYSDYNINVKISMRARYKASL